MYWCVNAGRQDAWHSPALLEKAQVQSDPEHCTLK
jgi:hypothetical protein